MKKNRETRKAARGIDSSGSTIWLFAASLILITLFAFYPSLDNDFVHAWDDNAFIISNPLIQRLDWPGIREMFTAPCNGNYIPLVLLSWAMEVKLWGMSPGHFHAVNLLLHLLCTFFVFRIFLHLGLSAPFAFFGALLFGVHPMRVESVAWLTERKDLLFAVFFLAAMLTYLRYATARKKKAGWYVATLLCFMLAVFAKIQAVTFPVAMLAVDYLLGREKWGKLILEKVPLFILSILIGIVGIVILRDAKMLELNAAFTLTERLLLGLYSLLAYGWKSLIPYPQSALYPYPASSGEPFPLIYWMAPVVLLGIAGIAWRFRHLGKAIIFGLAFFLVNIVLLLQILAAGIQGGFQAERYTYIPYLGLFFLMSWGLEKIARTRPAWRVRLNVMMAAMMLIYIPVTWARCEVWKDSYALWTDVITQYPTFPSPWVSRGTYFASIGQAEEALENYAEALRLDGDSTMVSIQRGDKLAANEPPRESPGDPLQLTRLYVYTNLGAIYGGKGDLALSLDLLNRALALRPEHPDALLNRGITLEQLGQHDAALADLKSYVSLGGNAAVLPTIVSIYKNQGRDAEALEWINTIIAQRPDDGNLLVTRAGIYRALGDTTKAREDARRAAKRGASVDPAWLAPSQ